MSLDILSAGDYSFEPRKSGTYEGVGTGLGKPRNEIRVTAGRTNAKTQKATAAVTRVLQKDFTPPGSTSVRREEAVVSVSWSLPSTGSFNESDANNLLQEIALVLSPPLLKRIFAGEN